MLVSEIATRVKRQFGDESGSLIDDNDILRWCNDGQVDIVRKTAALISSQTTAVTVGTSNVTLPADFLSVKGVVLANNPLSLVSYEEGFVSYASSAVDAQPGMCYVLGNKLYFNSQQASGNLVITYIRRPTVLTLVADTPEIPVQMHEDLVRFCLARAKELNEDLEGAAAAMSDYNTRTMYGTSEMATPDAASYNGIRVLAGDEGSW